MSIPRNVDEIVQNVTVYIDADLSAEMRDVDVKEEEIIDKFVCSGCGCKLVDGEPCSFYFTADYYRAVRSQMAGMTRAELALTSYLSTSVFTVHEENH